MKTSDKVLDAALELFIDHGYHGTSIKLIVEKSGVSTGSVYHHFSNKEEIIKELYARTKTHMNECILSKVDYAKTIRKVLRDYWYSRINYTINYPLNAKFISNYFNSTLVQSPRLESVNEMYNSFIHTIEESMNDDEIVRMDSVFFIYDLFNSCDAVSLYFETMNSGLDKDLIELAFRKYWRSIVKLDL